MNKQEIIFTEKIPFLDLKKQYLQIKSEVLAKIEEVLESTVYSGGKYVEEFEKHFAAYCHTDFAVGLNNGTSALHLAILALGIGQGDEVIVPGNTFIATAWGVTYAGATPVFVDCDPETWEIDASKIEEKITKRTKAIIGVHLYGQPFDVDTVKKVASAYNLYVIEDAAQAHGALYKDKRVGGLGEMACFSFYPGKNLGTYGEGGGITTNHNKYYEHLQSLRSHGSKVRYYHDEVGYNMRMGSIEAAVLYIKLQYVTDEKMRSKTKINYLKSDDISIFVKGNPLSCLGVFISRQIASEFHFNEDRLLSGSEDWELWIRIAANYGIKTDNRISAALIDHSDRSVVNYNEYKLVKRKELALHYAFMDQAVQEKFSPVFNKMHAYCDTYIALHLVLSRKYESSLKYLRKAFLLNPACIFERRIAAIVKHLILKSLL